jgi:hypothetical protein
MAEWEKQFRMGDAKRLEGLAGMRKRLSKTTKLSGKALDDYMVKKGYASRVGGKLAPATKINRRKAGDEWRDRARKSGRLIDRERLPKKLGM